MLFSRQNPAQARALALQVAKTSSLLAGDGAAAWGDSFMQDAGLARARCLRRLIGIDQWRGGDGVTDSGQPSPENTAGYLFIAAMNLSRCSPLSTEAHVFKLWYLASHAAQPPHEALRLLGDLRHLPAHQQLAAGARILDRIDRRMGRDVTPADPSPSDC